MDDLLENSYSSGSEDSSASSDEREELTNEIESQNIEKPGTDEEYPLIESIKLEDVDDIPRNDNHDQRPFIDKVSVLKKENDQSISPSLTPEEIKKRVSRMKKGSTKRNYNRNINKKGKKDTTCSGIW